MRRGRIAFLVVFAALMATAAPAYAGHSAELTMMDDQALLGASQAKIDTTLAKMQAFGVDRIRVSAFWSDIAPAATSTKKPAGFDAADPYDPHYDWAELDRVVAAAAARRMGVLLSISTPIPYWASQKPSLHNDVWEPKPAELAAFASAVAYRYRTMADQFAILNEPNQGAWLQPQSLGGKHLAPHLYRALVRAAYPAIKAADPRATVLVGELAPSGRNDPGVTRPIRPLAFLREMGCRDPRYRPVRSGRCKGFKPVPLDALGHHPYALFQSPLQRSVSRDDAAMGDWRRLEATLARLVRARALAPSHPRRPIPIYYTEFGYQTDPPDPYAGIPLARQSRWLQEAAYVAWRTPHVMALNQFRLSDGRIVGEGPLSFREFQSGLFFVNGKPKPAAATFANPIVVVSARHRLLVWGQARAGAAHTVAVQRRLRGSKTWRQIARARTSPRGYFEARVGRRAGSYRFVWRDASGSGSSQALAAR